MAQLDWVPDEIDTERPSIARLYDYLLGGSHNLAVDGEFAQKVMAITPDAAFQAQANRAFLNRAVRYLVAAGVRQFLDIGSGIPTRSNVHEVAQHEAPESRVIYVDIDPMAVSHSNLILAGNERAIAIQEDFRHADAILNHPEVQRLLDFTQPIGLLLVALLHAIVDSDDPYAVVRRFRDPMPSGSCLVIAHGTGDGRQEKTRRMVELSKQSATPLNVRPYAEVSRFFDGFTLVDPGLVWCPLWRTESADDVPEAPEDSSVWAGVGRKP